MTFPIQVLVDEIALLFRGSRNDDALATPTDAFVETTRAIGQNPRLSVYERKQRWVDKIQDLLFCQRAPQLEYDRVLPSRQNQGANPCAYPAHSPERSRLL